MASGRALRPAHAWVGDRATAYAIDSKHSAEVLGRVIGAGGSGVLSHDGFASYDRFEGAIHQQCVARARELLTAATRGAVRFPRQVLALFTEAIHWRNGTPRGVRTVDQLEGQREAFDDRLLDLVSRPRAVPEYAARARHLWNHFEPWFAFVFDPRIEPTNGRAEQAIRPAVVNRKVWGGNRTPAGAKAQGVPMSVLETLPPPRALGCGSRQPNVALVRQPSTPAPGAAEARIKYRISSLYRLVEAGLVALHRRQVVAPVVAAHPGIPVWHPDMSMVTIAQAVWCSEGARYPLIGQALGL